MNLPSEGETFTKIIEGLRHVQEDCAMMAHLKRDHNKAESLSWLAVSETLKLTAEHVTILATRGVARWN